MESQTISVLALVLGLVHLICVTNGQYSQGCTEALEDLPDPSSDSCQAFFRCFNTNQYSMRCPMGQVFDFDRARCRLASNVNCPLQLQRFQAPAVPSYLRPNSSPEDRDVEIRVVHLAPGTNFDANSLVSGLGTQAAVNGGNTQSQVSTFTGIQTHSAPSIPGLLNLNGNGLGGIQGQGQGQGQFQGQGRSQTINGMPTGQTSNQGGAATSHSSSIPNFLASPGVVNA